MDINLNWAELQQYVIAAALGVLVAGFLLLVKRIVWSRFLKWARTTDRPWDEIVLNQLRPPMNAILLLVAFSFGLQLTPEKLRNHPAIPVVSKLFLVLALLWMVNRVLTVVLEFWQPIKAMGPSTRTLILTLGRAVLLSLTLLIVLDILGVSITPLLASLGVGSVAVALALQDTLGNFFSGIYILIDKPIRLGDFIRLDGAAVEGVVRKIGWRSTHVDANAGNTIVIPNSRVSSSILTNFNFPKEDTSLTVTLGVAYGSDLGHVEKVAIQVGEEVLHRTPGAVTDYKPLVRFHTFAASSIDMNVILRAKSFPDLALLRHEFIKAIHARFSTEKIEIPFPQQVVHEAED